MCLCVVERCYWPTGEQTRVAWYGYLLVGGAAAGAVVGRGGFARRGFVLDSPASATVLDVPPGRRLGVFCWDNGGMDLCRVEFQSSFR